MWVAKALPMLDATQTAGWKNGANDAQLAFIDAVENEWEAIVAPDGAKRNELIKQLSAALGKKVGEYMSINDL